MTPKRILDIIVPMAIRSQNEFQWSHWRKYHQYRQKWEKALGFLAKRKAKKPEVRRYVWVASYRKRTMDEGNLIGGAKPILDYLTAANYLKDDAPQWAVVAYTQYADKARAGTTRIVVIEETDDATERPVSPEASRDTDTGAVGGEAAQAGTQADRRRSSGRKRKTKAAKP